MNDEAASTVLNQLQALRSEVRAFRAEANLRFEDIKARLAAVDGLFASAQQDITPVE